MNFYSDILCWTCKSQMSLLVNKALACFLAFNSLGLSLDLQTNLKSILFASERSH